MASRKNPYRFEDENEGEEFSSLGCFLMAVVATVCFLGTLWVGGGI